MAHISTIIFIRWYLIGFSTKLMVVNQYQSMVLNHLWNLFMASTPTRWHPVTFSVQQNLWNLISTKLMVLNPGTKL